MDILTLLLLGAGMVSDNLSLDATKGTPSQQQDTYMSTGEDTTAYRLWSSLSNQLQRASETGDCIHMLSSDSHNVGIMRNEADMCPPSGPSCGNMKKGSLESPKNHGKLQAGAWKNLVGLLKEEMSRGVEQKTRTYKYRRMCVSAEGSSRTVTCDVKEITTAMFVHEQNKTIFLHPKSSLWNVKFSLELKECSKGNVYRGVMYLESNELVGTTNFSPEWVHIELKYSRPFGHHFYSVTIPGHTSKEYNVSEIHCRGFSSYMIEPLKASLWHETCERMRTPIAPITIQPVLNLFYISIAATWVIVILALYVLRLTLQAKTLLPLNEHVFVKRRIK